MFEYLTGIYNITPTPFKPDGTLDEPSLRKLTDFTRGTRVNGMTSLGVLGEADKLTERERDRVTEIVIETAGANFPICVGTTHAGTDGCIAYSRRAQQLGAKAVMVAPCKLARNNDAALERHYLAVAEAIDIPVVVQDFPPAVGGIIMGVELVAKLAAASPRLAFLKLEDDPAPMKITQIRAISREVKIFGGLGGMMFLEELRHGAIGTMTGFAFPEILVEIYTKFMAGDRDGATSVFYKYLPIIRFENQPRINLALRKHIYHLRGVIASSRVRSPFTPVDAETLADLDDILANVPDVTSIPFFTTVSSAGLYGLVHRTIAAPSPRAGQDTTVAAALSSSDLVTLRAAAALGTGQGFSLANPLDDSLVLDEGERAVIDNAVARMNAAIDQAAQASWIAKVDFNGALADIRQNGLNLGGTHYSDAFVRGGLFSLDGVHPTDLAHAVIANVMIDAVNKRFGTHVPYARLLDYATLTSSSARPAWGEGRSNIPERIDGLEGMIEMLSPGRH